MYFEFHCALTLNLVPGCEINILFHCPSGSVPFETLLARPHLSLAQDMNIKCLHLQCYKEIFCVLILEISYFEKMSPAQMASGMTQTTGPT